ncbi:hypothetical protein TPHA_0E03390 [Tetrapisispora phaffii CBS 4417]|uniref:Protein CASP n=1 Tax=Tetrapisispora phaffii (strain ATCC 24235 / CBS 4417 / NBRC 1672 / NRRL Y-8282 / UCD 70-5) TaxID=1071381 RepID=G8BU51_TETPH|nr:hypothetical protein TPHA_0E03390 [Tetrapisispora phaffii CBS 4417]CCE63429.1 hypothetical protein TPHA_0E03390 [Tetrapisispora phaffii CBS 4417]
METSVYSHALKLWENADLTSLQKNLDSDVLDIKETESVFLDSRKSLATETKKFKKLENDEKLSQMNKLIKQYQQEIDSLTKRSKRSESILFNVYARLSETPDPKPLLQNSIEKFSNVEDSKELKEQVESLQDKLAKYADYESIKSRLLDLEQSSAVVLTKRLTAQEKELTSVWEAKKKNWEEKESEYTKQLQTLKQNNKVLELKVSKQVDIDGADDNEEADGEENNKFVNITENNFLVEELNSAQSRIFQLEKRNEELTASLAEVTNEAKKESDLIEKQRKISQLESENALLSASFERERIAQEKIKTTLSDQLSTSKVELASYKTELENVRRKLNNYSDYAKLKDELTALKKIEFGVDDVNSDEDDMDSNSSVDNKMETTLITANKKLQSNLAILRSKDTEQKEEIARLQKELQSLTLKVEELDKTNQKLERDLEAVEDIDQKFNDTASMMSGVTRQMNNRGGATGRLSPTSSIIGIPEESELPSSLMTNSSSILPIVTKQRDRFRIKNIELEKQIRQVNNEKGKLQSDINKLHGDYQKLTERLRHISSLDSSSSKINSLSEFDAEAQFSRSYDKSYNPLIDYKKKDSGYYKINRLPFTERIFMKFAEVVGSSKASRMVFVFYSLGVHGILLLLLIAIGNSGGYSNTSSASIAHSEALAATSQLGAIAEKLNDVSSSGVKVGNN